MKKCRDQDHGRNHSHDRMNWHCEAHPLTISLRNSLSVLSRLEKRANSRVKFVEGESIRKYSEEEGERKGGNWPEETTKEKKDNNCPPLVEDGITQLTEEKYGSYHWWMAIGERPRSSIGMRISWVSRILEQTMNWIQGNSAWLGVKIK